MSDAREAVASPPIDDARLDRCLDGIERGLADRQRRRARMRIVAPAALLAAACLLAFVGTRAMRPSPEVPRMERVTLPDGSQIAPAAAARYAITLATHERVAIAVESGALDFDVSHVDGRTFTVRAGPYEVSVIGTRFRVSVTSSDVEVRVERGRVRVGGLGMNRELGAGEGWSSKENPRASSIDSPPHEAPPDEAASVEVQPSASRESDPRSPNELARELFARGLEARKIGRDREAMAAFDRLRKTYRSDPRAGLAAYELGRIRLDTANDPRGAAEAFADAVALSPTGPFREDAEARRVDALDAAGDQARCDEAKNAYLGRYPSGLHVRRVKQRCGAR